MLNMLQKDPIIIAAGNLCPLFLLGLIPFIFQNDFLYKCTGLQKDYPLSQLGLGFFGNANFFDF